MKTFLLTMLGVMAFAPLAAMADDRPVIPPGVHYKFIDEATDAALRASLVANFQQGEQGVAGLFHGPCAVAPGYWKIIAGAGCVNHRIPTTFTVPDLANGTKAKLDGATTKDPDDLHRIAQHFAADAGKSPVIRRLTTDELKLMWAIVPFDIEEPVYVLENGPRHYVICMLKDATSDTYHIWWVDCLTQYSVTKPN